jgi:hypothetical protein
MSGMEALRTGQNATADDCARLWRTLTTEYIQDLRVEFTFLLNGDAPFGIQLDLVSEGLSHETGEACLNVWSTKKFWNPLHLISWGGLFDLLIVGYRQIDDYFRYGKSCAPVQR